MVGFRYLTSDHLQGFNKYKYNCKETSPLAVYVILPTWNALVKLLPMWLAPNLMTFVGWIMLMVNFWLLAYYDWDYNTSTSDRDLNRQPIPASLWVFCGVTHILAYMLDGMDGKQARRTGSSTPLGELFDHGCDSWSAILVPLGLMSALGRGSEWGGSPHVAVVPCITTVAGFYMCHWEKYITGCLYIPWIYDIMQLGCGAAYIATGVFGVQLWHFYLFPGWTFCMGMRWILMLGFVFSIPMTLYNIYQYHHQKSISVDGQIQGSGSPPPSGQRLSLTTFLAPWLPFLVFTCLYLVWAQFSPTDIVEREPRIFLFSMGVLFSNIACRLIISQMTSQPAELFNFLLIPLIAALVASFALPHFEMPILYSYFAVVLFAHLHYAISIVEELSEHLNINVFSIAKK